MSKGSSPIPKSVWIVANCLCRAPRRCAMPAARLTYKWADGTSLDLEVEIEDCFPDSADEARVQVLKLYREAVTELPETANEPTE